MKIKIAWSLLAILFLMVGNVNAEGIINSEDVINLPWQIETLDNDEGDVINLSTTLVGSAEIPFVMYTKSPGTAVIWKYSQTAAAPGNCPDNPGWVCSLWNLTAFHTETLSNVATQRTSPSTFSVAWSIFSTFGTSDWVDGYIMNYNDDMTGFSIHSEHLIDPLKFGEFIYGRPSIILEAGHIKMAAVFWTTGLEKVYKLVYMHYVGISNNSCQESSKYQCDVIETSTLTPISSPSLAFAGGKTGISYVKGNTIRYAYPWNGIPIYRPSNCGPGGNTWRCINIDAPGIGTIGYHAALAYGSDNTHAAILYNHKPAAKDFIMRATYVGSGGNCGSDGLDDSFSVIYRWDCSDLDAFIEDINQTTFAITFDPNNFPVASWNNKFTGDTAQRLYISYPNARIGGGGGWHKEIIDGNEWSDTGIWSDISFNSAGLGFIGYVQPSYRACGDPLCAIDYAPNLKVAIQQFKLFMPLVNR